MFSLSDVSKDLDAIAKKSGAQVDRLVEIIEETADLQEKVKRNLEAQVMQNVMNQILSADGDADFKFNKYELRKLQTKLSNIPGVTFDKANFQKVCGSKELTAHDIMRMFRNLKEDIPEKDNIFHLHPEKLVKTKAW